MKDWTLEDTAVRISDDVYKVKLGEVEIEMLKEQYSAFSEFVRLHKQEEREKARQEVVEEIIDFYKEWTIGSTDENGEYNPRAGIILSPEVLKAVTLKYLSKKGEK